MTKKSHRAKSSGKPAGPQSAQLEAFRKLSRAGRDQEARTRVMELRARYPDFRPLLPLAWEVEDNAGYFATAALHAWDWSQASPGSTAALRALADSAMSAGMFALAGSAGKRLAEAEGIPSPDLPPIHAELGDLSFEQGVKFDLSRLFLTNGRYDDVIAVLEGIDHPSARNNLALARFAKGDVAATLDDVEENWRRDTRNLFGLLHVVRLRLWTGGLAAAGGLADTLVEGRPTRPEDAYGQILGLLLLGTHAAAIDAWRTVRDAAFWGEADRMQSDCAYFAGIAALRQGDLELANECVSEALDIDPAHDDAAELEEALALREIGAEADPATGAFRDWFPESWLNEARAARRADAQLAAFDALTRRCDAHPDYLAIASELGGPVVRTLALATLKQRASSGDDAALDTLRSLLTRPCGPDEVRFDLNRWLEENGYLPQGQTHPLLIRGEVTEMQLLPMKITAEPKESRLPPAAQSRYERMHELLAQSDPQGALLIAQELADTYPDNPMLLGNLASIKEGLRHPDDEIEALYRRAAEIDPAYLFAQTGLARVAARKGDPDHARALLKPLYGREEYHVSEWRALLLTERTLAQQRGDMQLVLKLDAGLREIQERFD